jgi:hypothetical protein
MIIRKASLCLRFYVKHGWSRAAVAALGVPIRYVIPRSFDSGLDTLWEMQALDYHPSGWQVEGYLDFPTADYFAVYDPRVADLLDEAQLEVHHELVSLRCSS